jgi:hypothetical protein
MALLLPLLLLLLLLLTPVQHVVRLFTRTTLAACICLLVVRH